MKIRNVALTGFSGVLVAIVLALHLQIAMFLLGVAICLAISGGFILRGYRARMFEIRTTTQSEEVSKASATIRIEGREFEVPDLPRRLNFAVSCRNMHLLAAIGTVALGTVLVVVTGVVPAFAMSGPNTLRHWLYYVLSYFLFFLLLPCMAWLSECVLIRHAGITLANVHVYGRRGTIGYDFRGPQGGYHGGSTLNFGGPAGDNLKVVFCNPANPDASKLSAGLLFHKLLWADGR